MRTSVTVLHVRMFSTALLGARAAEAAWAAWNTCLICQLAQMALQYKTCTFQKRHKAALQAAPRVTCRSMTALKFMCRPSQMTPWLCRMEELMGPSSSPRVLYGNGPPAYPQKQLQARSLLQVPCRPQQHPPQHRNCHGEPNQARKHAMHLYAQQPEVVNIRSFPRHSDYPFLL